MPTVPVQIVEYISDNQPGFVSAQLVAAFGNAHTFYDSVPVFGCDPLDRDKPRKFSAYMKRDDYRSRKRGA